MPILFLLLYLFFKSASPISATYFVFDYPPDPATFVIELIDPQLIQTAKNNLGNPNLHLGGTITPQSIWYNQPWHYYLKPDSIYFFQNAIEICDASIQFIEDNLDSIGSTYLPKYGWCPWNSRLLREINPAGDYDHDGDTDYLDVHLLIQQSPTKIFSFNTLISNF